MARRYRPLKLLVAGGFGRTFLAQDESDPSQPRCVIKQFYPNRSKIGNSDAKAREATQLFHAEAERLEQLGKHPQIPELYVHLEQDSSQYIIQEFIDGQNLEEELAQQGPFSEQQIRQLLQELLPVLQYIHNGKVIHRDIKPANIIRRRLPPQQLVLVDFGAAKYATATTLAKTGTVIGSAGYAAPEQIYGKAVFASDIYSLGVTCVHLLTQVEPIELYDPLESSLAWRDYLVNNPVSEELGRVLDKMIAGSVKERFQSAEAVMLALGLSMEDWPKPETNKLIRVTEPPRRSRRLNLRSPIKVTTFPKNRGAVFSVAFSPDGQWLASGSGTEWSLWSGQENAVKLWNLVQQQEPAILAQHSGFVRAVAFSPNGRLLASGSRDRTIKIWSLRTCQVLQTLKGHSFTVNSLAFSPNGQQLVSGSEDGTVRLWGTNTGRQLDAFDLPSSQVYSVALSPDGEIVAVGGIDKAIALRSLITGRTLRPLKGHADSVYAMAFSPDGELLASGSGDWDCTVKLWEVLTGRAINLKGHTDSVYAVAFSPDGELLASGSGDRSIKLWEVSTGRLLRTLKGHTAKVNSLAFSPDGQRLASGSDDGLIKLWQLPLEA